MYDCTKCPGYCCSYPIIPVSKRDALRLAKHLGLSLEACVQRHMKSGWGRKRILKRKPDKYFGRICGFFDTEARRCTVYEGRPRVCRSFPGKDRCGYYDFLTFERQGQSDDSYVALTDNSIKE